jgi:hypothetical protein
MRVIGACIRVIYAGSAHGALGRATFNPLVQGSTPWRPTRQNVVLIMVLVDRLVDRVAEERICPRDAGELTACFAAHAAGVFGYACVLARGDRALADDLVQAAFEAGSAGRSRPPAARSASSCTTSSATTSTSSRSPRPAPSGTARS